MFSQLHGSVFRALFHICGMLYKKMLDLPHPTLHQVDPIMLIWTEN